MPRLVDERAGLSGGPMKSDHACTLRPTAAMGRTVSSSRMRRAKEPSNGRSQSRRAPPSQCGGGRRDALVVEAAEDEAGVNFEVARD